MEEPIATLLERTARVEAKLDLSLQMNEQSKNAVSLLAERMAKAEASTKSAHKRLDDMDEQRKEDKEFTKWVIGIAITAAGIISGIITTIISSMWK